MAAQHCVTARSISFRSAMLWWMLLFAAALHGRCNISIAVYTSSLAPGASWRMQARGSRLHRLDGTEVIAMRTVIAENSRRRETMKLFKCWQHGGSAAWQHHIENCRQAVLRKTVNCLFHLPMRGPHVLALLLSLVFGFMSRGMHSAAASIRLIFCATLRSVDTTSHAYLMTSLTYNTAAATIHRNATVPSIAARKFSSTQSHDSANRTHLRRIK